MANGVRYSSTRLLSASATYRLPELSTATSTGLHRLSAPIPLESPTATPSLQLTDSASGCPINDISRPAVDERGGVGPSEHAIVGRVGDVEAVIAAAGIDRDSRRRLQCGRGRIVDSVVNQVELSEHRAGNRRRRQRRQVLEDAAVRGVGDKDVARTVHGDAVRRHSTAPLGAIPLPAAPPQTPAMKLPFWPKTTSAVTSP